MFKVAVLDDYQNVFQDFVDLKKLSEKYEIKIFSEPFKNEEESIQELKEFQALLVMRERTFYLYYNHLENHRPRALIIFIQ